MFRLNRELTLLRLSLAEGNHGRMERTIESLQNAIKANLDAQSVVRKEIEVIATRKIENRRKAGSLRVPLTCMIDGQSDACNRQWSRRFFEDEAGCVPLPNEDSILRSKLESAMFAAHRSPLWSKKEVLCLHDIVRPMQAKHEGSPASSIDFQQVADKLNEMMKSQRSAEECEVKFQPNRAPFTKQESLMLLRQFHSGEDLKLPQRTKWQALQAFHAASNKKKVPWTLEQDEVLFKTVAASGPQQVLSQHFASHLSAVLQKSPKTILQRTMTSLINPTFFNDLWSDEDERRLCLLMKVYRDSPNPMVSVTVRNSKKKR
jgi:hypothetical protein